LEQGGVFVFTDAFITDAFFSRLETLERVEWRRRGIGEEA